MCDSKVGSGAVRCSVCVCVCVCLRTRAGGECMCVFKVALKCRSRGGESVEGVVIVTVGYKSFIAPACSGLLN